MRWPRMVNARNAPKSSCSGENPSRADVVTHRWPWIRMMQQRLVDSHVSSRSKTVLLSDEGVSLMVPCDVRLSFIIIIIIIIIAARSQLTIGLAHRLGSIRPCPPPDLTAPVARSLPPGLVAEGSERKGKGHYDSTRILDLIDPAVWLGSPTSRPLGIRSGRGTGKRAPARCGGRSGAPVGGHPAGGEIFGGTSIAEGEAGRSGVEWSGRP